MSARIAVLVPCYDDAETLPETLASLEQQGEHELVVVDDGSRDEATLALLDDLRERGVRVVTVPNGGPGAARNVGLRATSAPYVFPLDADDLLLPGALDALADALDADPGVAAAWGDIELFGGREAVRRMPDELDPWLVTYSNRWTILSAIRRDALEQVGGWPEGTRHEDWYVWQSLAERGFRGRRIDRVVGRYRVGVGRRWAAGVAVYGDTIAHMRANHPALFAARSENRRRSPAPWWLKVALPVVDRAPGLSPYTRRRIAEVLISPGWTLGWAVRRRLRRLLRGRAR